MFTDAELSEIVAKGLKEAGLELKGENEILNVTCDIKNGDKDGVSNYAQRIISNKLNDSDKAREKRLKELTKEYA